MSYLDEDVKTVIDSYEIYFTPLTTGTLEDLKGYRKEFDWFNTPSIVVRGGKSSKEKVVIWDLRVRKDRDWDIE